ncbi:hypothetical protein [Streptomyces sp. NPDC008317]|uniref:hypothetical protein n=1 Tax=Streptomyces sp. NPDC008317 TaxID=3364827 RepID=UPI0036E81C30
MSADIFPITPESKIQAAHLRCTLRRALALQATENIWSSTEHVNNAVVMVCNGELPDTGRWLLTRSQLHTLTIAIEWRRAKRAARDQNAAPDVLERWTEIEDHVMSAYWAARRGEGTPWT